MGYPSPLDTLVDLIVGCAVLAVSLALSAIAVSATLVWMGVLS